MSRLADAVLVLHVLFVAFVVGGLGFIWIGAWHGWNAIGNRRFRIIHFGAIALVAAEALIGVTCPLTAWEDRLRGQAADSWFVARWLQRVLYYDLPEWVFLTAYLLFAAAVAITYILIPPRSRQ